METKVEVAKNPKKEVVLPPSAQRSSASQAPRRLTVDHPDEFSLMGEVDGTQDGE